MIVMRRGACVTNVATVMGGVAPPVNTVPPSITGTATEGQTLTGVHGTYAGVVTSYTYRWLRSGVAIGGATAQTYLLVGADVGSTITFEETPTGPGGTGAAATSAATASVASMYLLRDTFTDANGTALAAHTMDVGPGWTALAQSGATSGTASSATIQSNRVQMVTGDLGAFASESGRADVTITLTGTCGQVSPPINWAPSIVCRCTGSGNCWLARMLCSGVLDLYQLQAGAFTLRASGTWTKDTSPHVLQVVAVGTSISVSLDGGAAINYGSATFNQTATQHGLAGFNAGGHPDLFDDFTVTA